jgi:hypothetical protein
MNQYSLGRTHMRRGWLHLLKRNSLSLQTSARRVICAYLIDLTDLTVALFLGLDDARFSGVALSSGQK